MPVILNTSFNLKGEPIVTTPDNAFSTFHRSGMDTLVLGNCVVAKGNKATMVLPRDGTGASAQPRLLARGGELEPRA